MTLTAAHSEIEQTIDYTNSPSSGAEELPCRNWLFIVARIRQRFGG